MNIQMLIDAASEAVGSKAALARAMNKQAQRVSEWYRNERKPDANELAFMAEKAGLPVLETVAEIESQMDERYAHIWREALGKMKAAGIAVSFAAVTLSGALSPPDVSAKTRNQGVDNQPLYIM